MRELRVKHTATRSTEMVVGQFIFDEYFDQIMCNESCSYLNMSLTPRPSGSRSRYLEFWRKNRFEPIGRIVLQPYGTKIHAEAERGSFFSLSCLIDSKMLKLDADSLSDSTLTKLFDIKNSAIQNDLDRILKEMSSPSLASGLALEGASILLAADLTQYIYNLCKPERKVGGLSPHKLRLVEDRIKSSLPLPTISELADLCGLSERHLARVFRQEIGQTVAEYIKEAALERACWLLRETTLSIKQVAGNVGFANSSTFGFAFRRETGIRPSDFRANSRI